MGKIISLISIKGGAGKSVTTINLAETLSKKFKKNVLIVEANFSAPNLILYLGLEEPKKGIHQLLQGNADYYEAIHNTPYGFQVIPARMNNKIATRVSSLKMVLDPLKEKYDFILLDTSPNVNAEINSSIRASDYVLLLMNPDLPCLSCTLLSDSIVKENEKKIAGVILNKVTKNKHELKNKDIENTLGMKIISKIPYDPAIYEASLKNEPLEIKGRKKSVSEYTKLAKKIISI